MLRDPGLVPLSRDHHHALALCVYTHRSLARDSSPEGVARQARSIVEQFDADIKDHFEFEETVLFPVLRTAPGFDQLVEELTAEHRTMYALIDALRGRAERATVEEFCAVLRGHVRKEEQVLFEEAQRVLTRFQLDAIGERDRERPSRRGA